MAYLGMLFLIGLVSVYDTALIAVYGDSIFYFERSPVGVWLLNRGGIPFFMTVKAICTLCVVLLCVPLIKTKYRVAIPWVLLFQGLLFLWLTFSGKAGIFVAMFDDNSPIQDVINFYTYGTIRD